ncbi:RNase H domain-containing protein [Trichonephila clavipes]|uniref:RNase H domain-containing protein n=1 Tax=Trichonephila clavipes TaxID=2585209 RepID=A0A8X6RC35_TRICX|nr:RNase H domain-containing protein [Trichonephila clavipes]
MSSPGFKLRPYGTAVSVSCHCTGWVAKIVVNVIDNGSLLWRLFIKSHVLGSGTTIKMGNGIRICKRNPDICSVFRAELIAIKDAMKFCFTKSVKTGIWIWSDSRSSIQHLSEWWKRGDRTTTSMVQL